MKEEEDDVLFRIIIITVFFVSFLLFFPPQKQTISLTATYNENYYNTIWCSQRNGEIEVVLSDRTRCDCIVTVDGMTYAVEMDWEKKWYNAVGQSLHYATVTGYKPGIVLITKNQYSIYVDRLHSVVKRFNLPIQVWKIEAKRN